MMTQFWRRSALALIATVGPLVLGCTGNTSGDGPGANPGSSRAVPPPGGGLGPAGVGVNETVSPGGVGTSN